MTSLRIAALQTNPVWGQVADNTTAALDLIPADCDLVVLPELFSTGYQFRSRQELHDLAEDLTGDPEPGSACARLSETATATNTTIVAGLAEKSGAKLYNSAVLVHPNGHRDIYRKVHLFADEKLVFDPGDLGFPVFEACGIKVGLMVCYDWVYPESARSLALSGADLICHPANLVLPWCPDAMITRCLENRVFAVTANRVGTESRTQPPLTFIGMSQVVSPMGQRLAACGRLESGVTTVEIDVTGNERQVTPRNHLWQDRRPEAYTL